MLLGMAAAQAEAVRADVGGLLLYTPVVHPEEFDAAISYLVRRLEENASTENFMSGVFELDDAAIYQRERDRFSPRWPTSTSTCRPRAARRTACTRGLPHAGRDFENEPDTDPALAANRAWGRGILARSAKSKLGVETNAAAVVPNEAALRDASSPRSAQAGAIWGKVPGTDRGELLDRVGEVLSVFRGRLIEVMASETGKTIAEADVEVSEAIDFAHFYAARARELAAIDGAVFVPGRRDRRDAAVELPGRDPRRRGALRARRRQRRAVQARPPGPALRRRARRGDLGGRRPARAA